MPRSHDNPKNRYHEVHLEWDEGEAPPAELRVYEERCTRALSENRSPDLGFHFSVNPYRGCFHACSYCYARRTHPYLGFGAGTDFDRRIVVKVNVAEQLAVELDRPSFPGDVVVLSGNTDCYQPLEARYRLTRACLEVLLQRRNPTTVITKGTLIRRDADVLAELVRRDLARVALSIPFADEDDARCVEPNASPPRKRFETVRVLTEAGVPVAVVVAPVIPGLNDHQVPEILERARDAGARRVSLGTVRLPGEVRQVFFERLRASHPLRASKIERGIREQRGGRLDDSRFHHRRVGHGARYAAVRALFEAHCRRLGLEHVDPRGVQPRRRAKRQLSLFE